MKQRTIKKPARRGITLIEVGVASTISSLIAAIGVGLICSLMAVNSATKVQADQQRTVARLADTFRADAHRAEGAKLEVADSEKASSEEAESGMKCIVFKQEGERSIRYTLTDSEVLRQISSGGKRIAVDSFLFSNEVTFDVALESVGEKTLAVLTIDQRRAAKSRKRLPPIAAAVGTGLSVVEILLPPEAKAVEKTLEEKSAEEKSSDKASKPEQKEGAEQ